MVFTPYLNVEEVESALETSALAHPALCELIELPEHSFEGRVSHALRIGAPAHPFHAGVLLLGGTHAREWGSSDILVALAENLINAYETGSGLTFAGKTYTAAEVRRIIETIDLFLFPDVNPDGKAYSQSGFDWRKNRRPLPGGAIGVDINRNYDFLWDANAYFDPSLSFSYLYTPTGSTYHGPAPFSETESRNVRWLLDHYPQISWFADLHSFGQKIMCVWGDDENQNADPEETFGNAAFDGKRGVPADAYGEFLFSDDDQKQLRAANLMRDAIFSVRGSSYTVGQIYDQVGVSAGDSAPWVFSRHITDRTRRKVFAFGIEWGTWFQPAPAEMTAVMDDIQAGLTELCLCAAEPDLFIRDHLGDLGAEPNAGPLSISPDIVVRKDAIADPAAAFADPNVDPGSDKVEIGNDNHVYVRVHNRGGQPSDASVRVYFAPLTTSCAPSLWTLIDEVGLTAVPGGGFSVAGPVLWPHVESAGTAGHFCLIALCSNAVDPFPDPSMIDSAGDFMRWMRNGNNQAYRNVAMEDVRPDEWAAIPVVLHALSARKDELFDFVVDARPLTPDSRILLERFPIEWAAQTLRLQGIERAPVPNDRHLAMRGGGLGLLERVRLPAARRLAPFTLRVHMPATARPGSIHRLSVVQKFTGTEIGRISVQLRCIPR